MDVLKMEGIGIVVDLDSKHTYVGEGAERRLDFLEAGEKHEIEGNPDHHWRRVNYDDYNYIHFFAGDLPDLEAFKPEQMEALMKELDGVKNNAANGDIPTGKIAFHCQGGLGRAPMVMVANELWDVAKGVRERGGELTCDFSRDGEWAIDGKVNMANVLLRIEIKGYESRSTFMQTRPQMLAVRDFAIHLFKNQNDLFHAPA
jgi:hypothetical protein